MVIFVNIFCYNFSLFVTNKKAEKTTIINTLR